MASRTCLVQISPDGKKLTWDYWGSKHLKVFSSRHCLLEEVQSVLYGPITHTFRAYRIANLMAIHSRREYAQPFFGWQCVSLKLPNRTIDFVI